MERMSIYSLAVVLLVSRKLVRRVERWRMVREKVRQESSGEPS